MNLISGERVDILQESLLRVLKLRGIKQYYSTLKGITLRDHLSTNLSHVTSLC
jgi:hypothetical protein